MVDLTSLNVLVVDDQEFVRTIVRGMLTQLGIKTVQEASDGQSAMAVVAETRPDLIICDIQMRPVDGFGFVRLLRDDPASGDIPVIMLTAHSDSATVSRGRGMDIDAYVAKPILPDSLAMTMTKVLERRSSAITAPQASASA